MIMAYSTPLRDYVQQIPLRHQNNITVEDNTVTEGAYLYIETWANVCYKSESNAQRSKTIK